jgi:hypothetical protein
MAGTAREAKGAAQYYPGCVPPSSPYNWSNYFVPQPADGAIVTIPAGDAVYVDVTTAKLDLLIVEGALIWDH